VCILIQIHQRRCGNCTEISEFDVTEHVTVGLLVTDTPEQDEELKEEVAVAVECNTTEIVAAVMEYFTFFVCKFVCIRKENILNTSQRQ
jgi:hypothetical protein